MSLLFLSQLRYLVKHKLLTLLAIIGIGLGVAVVTAVDMTNESAKRSFAMSFQQTVGSATHRIVSSRHEISEDVYHKIRTTWVPKHYGAIATPQILSHLTTPLKPGKLLQSVGVDPLSEAKLRGYMNSPIKEGSDTIKLISSPLSVLISANLAKDLGLIVDDKLPVNTVHGITDLRIIGLIGDESDSSLANLIIMDIGTSQTLLRTPGKLSQINVFIPSDIPHGNKALEALTSLLPSDVYLQSTEAALQSQGSLTQAFYLNLTALSLLALVVGAFIIFNTLNISVLQRQVEFGRLRALGVSVKEIQLLVMTEALALALLATPLGIFAGLYLSKGLLFLVNRTVDELFYTVTITQHQLATESTIKGILLGLLATALAAYLPARKAALVDASNLLQRITQEKVFVKNFSSTASVSVALFLLGCIVLLIPNTGLVGGFISLAAFVFAAALLTPAFVWKISYMVTPVVSQFTGPLGALVTRDTARQITRTGFAIMALSIAMSTSNGMGTMVNSFRGSMQHWLENRFQSDLFVGPQKSKNANQTELIDAKIEELVINRSGVLAASRYYNDLVESTHFPVDLVAVDLPNIGRPGYLLLQDTDLNAWQRFNNGEIFISEPLANKRHLAPGDLLPLMTDKGWQTFRIAAIYYDYSSQHGKVMMSMEHFERFWPGRGIQGIWLFLNKDVDKPAFIAQLESDLGTTHEMEILDNAARLKRAITMFDRTFIVTDVLRYLALIIAGAGVMSALLALQLERNNEFAVMRSIGMSRRQITGILLGQAGFIGLLTGIIAVPLGQLMAWMLIDVINLRAFGWTMVMEPGWGLSIQTIMYAVVASLLAGLYPAWRFGYGQQNRGFQE